VDKLKGKVAIVTGGGQGIGEGISLAFAKEGAKVVVADINSQTAKAVTDEIHELGGIALAVQCDVGDEQQVKHMVDQVVQEFGPIDILVNNAQSWGSPHEPHGAFPAAPLEETREDEWDHTFQTGAKATFYCCKAVFPYMKERGGKIINFGSANGILGREGSVAYNANKEAIRAITRTAAREWGKYKINVNVICPGAETPALNAFRDRFPQYMKALRKSIPLGRFGDPEKDVGRIAVFLASEDSDYLTGHTFLVDGGGLIHA